MKKFVALLVLFGLLGISVFAQSSRKTRPRIVKESSPPNIKNDNSTSTNKRPPVLIGNEEIGEPPPLPPNPNEIIVADEDDDIIKVETNLVTMPVSVLDRSGRFVSGLQQRDFKVFEDGVEQEIGFFARVETPFTVILMLDVSPSTQYKINEIQDAAISFVNQLRRDDRIMVIEFDDNVNVLARPTNDRRVLQNAIRRARFGDGTSLYDAVDRVINRELRQIEGRKAVVIFTDGVDTTSNRAGYQGTVRQVEEVDALFYPIRYDTSRQYGNSTPTRRYPTPRRRSGGGILGDILGSIIIGGGVGGGSGRGRAPAGSTQGEYEKGKRYLEELAINSGGRKFETSATYDLDAAFRGIAEELRQQYSIGYYPQNVGQIGERKRVRIRVMRPSVVVRAKNSYIVKKGNNSNFAGN